MSITPDNLPRLLNLAHSTYRSKTKFNKQIVFRFSFAYLVRGLENFDWSGCGNHEKILNSTIDILKDFSSMTSDDISSNRQRAHTITIEQLKRNGHEAIVNAFNSISVQNFIQIGPADETECTRIFGFIDPKSDENIFQVCIIDHDHNIFPKRKVFMVRPRMQTTKRFLTSKP